MAETDDEGGESQKKVAWGSGPKKVDKFANTKKYVGHAVLFLSLVLYTAAGAFVFQKLEHPHEIETKDDIRKTLISGRTNLTIAIMTGVDKLNATLEGYIAEYELVIEKTLDVGVRKYIENKTDTHWDYIRSAFFASTVLTTIGYGDMAPRTYWGRVFCICFALIGIPFTLTVIADLGKFMASAVSFTWKKFRKHFPKKAKTKSSKLSKKLGKSATVGAIVGLLLLYIAAGGGLFMIWEEDWTFFTSFYFCFITMTTIGFGDIVPEKTDFMLLCTLYILVGLALTSTAIELVRTQYADSWRRMRELSTRLQGLSGPLAETLRKYGDNMNLDMNVLKDLKDLKKALAMSSGKMKQREGSIWKKFWENEDGFDMDVVESDEPRLIQIIIYESSV